MTTYLLTNKLHGEIEGLGEVGYYDELFFFLIAIALLTVVGMSWFFVQGEEVYDDEQDGTLLSGSQMQLDRT